MTCMTTAKLVQNINQVPIYTSFKYIYKNVCKYRYTYNRQIPTEYLLS